MTPKGLISPEELPEGHGLLEWDGKKITRIINATFRQVTNRADLIYLCSILRRERFKGKVFNYRGQNTTIKPKIF